MRSGLTLIYDALGWVFLPMVALLVHRERKDQGLHIWRTYIYSSGWPRCYAFLPVVARCMPSVRNCFRRV